jgi:hypothetical protein
MDKAKSIFIIAASVLLYDRVNRPRSRQYDDRPSAQCAVDNAEALFDELNKRGYFNAIKDEIGD